eukprot:TRINITY_DN293_c1_g1_i2.p1 TRINITY_DN293_c1_g1~~TRINITY_DN293_c1_g1_i2.p1  ORF type:complete len:261 (-),score=55.10 TRINITY_DN293_c1_g1_i2:1370-2152(-)
MSSKFQKRTTISELEEIAAIEKKIKRKLRWKKRYQTGIPIVDKQHKNFFILLGTIRKVSKQKKSAKFIRLILEELVHYCKVHFSTEERVLEESGYPDIEGHKESHAKFTALVNKKVAEFKLFKVDVIDQDFFNWLLEWLQTHITVEDVHHCTYTKNQIKLQQDNETLKNIILLGPPEFNLHDSIPPMQQKLNEMRNDPELAEIYDTEEKEKDEGAAVDTVSMGSHSSKHSQRSGNYKKDVVLIKEKRPPLVFRILGCGCI